MNKPRAKLLITNAVLLIVVVLPILATGLAMVMLWNRLVTWTDVALLVGMYSISALGITVGYHRMLTHKGFDAPQWLRGLFLIMGSMALQGPPVEWAATHYKHHAKADTEEDPHSPVYGFFDAHVGWLFKDRFVTEGVYAKPFVDDPVAVFVSKTFLIWVALGFLIPFLIGGWTGLLWGGLVRVFLGHHVTWSVNSVCHTFGRRPWATKDESRNEWVVGLLGFGEGWHNNHHAQPSSAFHGFRWWQVDGSGYLIRGLERAKLIKNVVRPDLARLKTNVGNTGGRMVATAHAAKEAASLKAHAAGDAVVRAKDAAVDAMSEKDESGSPSNG